MNSVEEMVRQAEQAIRNADTSDALRQVESHYLGKNGEITARLRRLGELPEEERKEAGRSLNEAKQRLATLVEEARRELRAREQTALAEREAVDITMPGRPRRIGYEHVLQRSFEEIKRVMTGLGFEYLESPELESFHYNFEALNYPADHPAMDEQDTFYISDDLLLRTQCTAIQGRVFETRRPPIRIFTIGRTFRNEAVDRTHSHTFHQIDCFMVDRGVSMAHLKGTLGAFARAMFGEDVKVRFRPDFFPFVEPGVDYAISCPFCSGKGCAVCKSSGWIELGGAGLIHPNILERYGFDTETYSGFAFGLGVERVPMLAYGIDDLRHFLENDLRFLAQFR